MIAVKSIVDRVDRIELQHDLLVVELQLERQSTAASSILKLASTLREKSLQLEDIVDETATRLARLKNLGERPAKARKNIRERDLSSSPALFCALCRGSPSLSTARVCQLLSPFHAVLPKRWSASTSRQRLLSIIDPARPHFMQKNDVC